MNVQLERNAMTRRVLSVTLTADAGADEIFLSALVRAFRNAGNIVVTSDGKSLQWIGPAAAEESKEQ